MHKSLPLAVCIDLVAIVVAILIIHPLRVQPIYSASTQPLISEIQVTGTGGASDEFVEIYNPTADSVDLTGWTLKRKASGGTEYTMTVVPSGSIGPHGYFLFGGSAYSGTATADASFATSIGNDNTILLYNDSSTVVDKVGMGNAADPEGSPSAQPASGESLERKANASSTADSMGSGGADEFAGNGYDTEDNLDDFVILPNPDPQNSSSAPEPALTPTPSPEPTVTITPTAEPSLTPTESPTPSVEPTLTPTESPSPSPEPTVTVTPTIEPSLTPTESPTPSPEPTVTVTPTLEPTVTPTETPTETPTPTLTPMPTVTETPTTSPTPSPEPSVTPTVIPELSPTPTPTTIPTPTPFIFGTAVFPTTTITCYLIPVPVHIPFFHMTFYFNRVMCLRS